MKSTNLARGAKRLSLEYRASLREARLVKYGFVSPPSAGKQTFGTRLLEKRYMKIKKEMTNQQEQVASRRRANQVLVPKSNSPHPKLRRQRLSKLISTAIAA